MNGEVFLLGGAKLNGTSEVETFLKGNGIQRAWKGALFGLGLGNEWKPAKYDHAAWFSWPGALQLDSFTLHAAILEVDAGYVDWSLLLQSEEHSASALLLASPTALGRGNLLPVAGIHSALGVDLPSCLQILQDAGVEGAPEVVCDSLAGQAKQTFPDARVLEKTRATIPGQILDLQTALAKDERGLLMIHRPGAAFAFWLEGV